MKYHQDITIIPCAELSVYHIWEQLFRQFHLAVVDTQDTFTDHHDGQERQRFPLGVAFPQYRYNKGSKHLGNVLRIFAQEKQSLLDLNTEQWLARLADYVHIRRIMPVPEKIKGYYSFWSPKPHSNVHRLARRKAKYEHISVEQALQSLKDFDEKALDYPYIHCDSSSSSQRFRRFIQSKPQDEYHNKGFNSYGLSSQSSLPDF